MASSSSSFPFIFLCCFLCIVSSSLAKTSSRPKSLVLHVTKDAKTLQYVTQVSQRTPLIPVKLTLDLGGEYMWVNCEGGYKSSTYRPARCGSAPCKLLNTTTCFTNNTCSHNPYSSISKGATSGHFGGDVFAIGVFTMPRLYFICGTNLLSEGLASGVTGMAGLGRTRASLPAQLSTYFKIENKFSLCLSSSTKSSGLVFFGNGPSTMLPNVDVLSSLTYTPLIVNPVGQTGFEGDASPRYFIGVTSIKINERPIKFNNTLLKIDKKGNGGTTLSTADPYTLLESSLFKDVTQAFATAMPKNVKRVANVAPFGACFSSENIGSTRLGPAVPSIDIVLQNKSVHWRIFGANSMVEVKKNVMCLAFAELHTTLEPKYSIVIGGHQLEDNLLQFDLSTSRLGFSSSLLGRSTTCANFNFTSVS